MAATTSGVRSNSNATTVPGPAPACTNRDAMAAARSIQLPIGQCGLADLHRYRVRRTFDLRADDLVHALLTPLRRWSDSSSADGRALAA